MLKFIPLIFGFICLSLSAQNRLIIGVEEQSYPPYYDYDGSKMAGCFAPIINKFADEYGYDITFKSLPIKRLYRDLRMELIDLKFPDNPHWWESRTDVTSVRFSAPVIHFSDGYVVLDKNIDIKTDELKSIGKLRGFTLSMCSSFGCIGEHQLKVVGDSGSLINQLEGGHVDAVFANIKVLEQLSTKPIAMARYLPQIHDSYRVSSVSRPDVIAKLDIFLQAQHSFIRKSLEQHGCH